MERTVSIKLGNEHHEEFSELANVFVSMLNEIASIAWEAEQFSANGIHYLCYHDIRKHFPLLKSNHICAGFKVVAGALKAGKTSARKRKKRQTKPVFTKPTVAFDCRTSKVTKDHISLSTLGDRIHIDIELSDYQLQFFDGTWNVLGSKLIKRNGCWYLNVCASKDAPQKREEGRVLGVDQGIRHIAVTSDGKFIRGGKLNHRTSQTRLRRGELDSKGTPSSRKRLKSLSRRENRFRDDFLHCAVKSILEDCDNVRLIVLEDLERIEGNKGCTMNRRLSNWAFARFRSILENKAEERGIAVETIDARYTSQKCSGCGEIEKSNRNHGQHLYSCSCGLILNDDLPAARTIRNNYLLSIGEGDGVQSTTPYVTPPGCDKLSHSGDSS